MDVYILTPTLLSVLQQLRQSVLSLCERPIVSSTLLWTIFYLHNYRLSNIHCRLDVMGSCCVGYPNVIALVIIHPSHWTLLLQRQSYLLHTYSTPVKDAVSDDDCHEGLYDVLPIYLVDFVLARCQDIRHR